jgi:hypothetical protein
LVERAGALAGFGQFFFNERRYATTATAAS